ncbi:E3 ubiquitin-protein ligase ATL6-like [Lolium perenne]|uniref:E3 ubiquitin-protein ligase ATL6-like n=1 Tax=Lolium perenne TaxID=4522 RepID=UPI0021F623AC|nr:putative RING-H2 finger protein ATL69 [Lolium perenne]
MAAATSSPEVDGLVGIWGRGSWDPTKISGGEDPVDDEFRHWPTNVDPDVAFYLEIAAVVAVALIIVAIASRGVCEGAEDISAGTTGRAAVHATDVESALGDITLMTYEQAATGKVKEEERCAMCLSEYGEDGELVRVVPACGHFFHARCDVDRWLRKSRTCPLCRGGLWPECPPMPPRQAIPLV